MWILTVRSPSNQPVEYFLKPGKNSLGRKPGSDILIDDEGASRVHAEIFCEGEMVVITDQESMNGTFVNRERITKPHTLQPGDQIRIGQHEANLSLRDDKDQPNLLSRLAATRPWTRELLLESVDQHAVLLYDVTNQLTRVLDLDTAVTEISKLMKVALGADTCDVILAKNFDGLGEYSLPVAVTRQAIEQRSIVVVPSLTPAAEQSQLSAPRESENRRSALCVPVFIDDEIVALIVVYKSDPGAREFDQHDVQMAVAISHQAGLTIQRVNLLKQARILEDWAITDSLTGLHNRRHLIDLGELEFQRARRYKHPLSIVMLDVDHFKQVNDTYGHDIGDQVLKTVARSCREQLRNIDLIGRYGGDEFVILLIETDLLAARGVAERVRLYVSGVPAETERGPLSATVSIGISALDPDTLNLDALLSQADKAMYSAKKAGRNKVKSSTPTLRKEESAKKS
jgi:diguanylate cyclase (GGDEF)-like protein